MRTEKTSPRIRFGLPKGRIQANILRLLTEAGIAVRETARSYRPLLGCLGYDTKVLKPQSIIEMLQSGSRDLGFAGADWVAELEADVIEVLDTGLDPVRIVAAVPPDLLVGGILPARRLTFATEYPATTARWISERGLDACVLRAFGATEVYPPEDADGIVDNTATGSTLSANNLQIVDVVARSTTRLYASRAAMADSAKRASIEEFALLVDSVLAARRRVMIEVNVAENALESLVTVLPCMREPTIAKLYGGSGYSVKAAVPRDELPTLVPLIRANGGEDLVVVSPTQIVA